MRTTTSSSTVYSSLLFRRAPSLSLVVASYLSALPLSIFQPCVYDALVFRSYLHDTLQPHITLSPHPSTHCLFICQPCEFQACSGCFESVLLNLIWICYLVTTSHDTLLLMLVWEYLNKIRHLWETLGASFGHYALVLLMSPRLIVLLSVFRMSALTTWGRYGTPPDNYQIYSFVQGHKQFGAFHLVLLLRACSLVCGEAVMS